MKIYVAVVVRGGVERSQRPEGDWASFVNKDKKAAIAAAMKACGRWEAKGFGPYQIWVGQLTQEANVPVKYELAAIKEKKPAATVFDWNASVAR